MVLGLPRAASQGVLSAALLASTYGTYISLTPPQHSSTDDPSTPRNPGDTLTSLGLTTTTFANLALAQLLPLSIHHALLAWHYPSSPASLLGHGIANKINPFLFTWSPGTSIPLALIFLVGIPLRLIPVSTLGKDFTFFLRSPVSGQLTTTGIYAYVQHPAYVGLVTLMLSNVVLLGRMDGVVSCWFSPKVLNGLSKLTKRLLVPVGLSLLFLAMWRRVAEEEKMLREEFGEQWEEWHRKTARFLPGIF
jgi:protein-S-isoprenylcysteine O-methyltransferase Ste14